MNKKNVHDIESARISKKKKKPLDQIARDELKKYLSNSTKEPDAIASGDMKKIIDGTEDDNDEENR